MPLIKEDGSGVSGADTFVTVSEFRAFAGKRGVTYGASDSVVESYLVKALDLITSFEARFAGRASTPLVFPRTGSEKFTSTEIPRAITDAQCFAAMEAAKGVDLLPSSFGPRVLRRKVDVIDTQYADEPAQAHIPSFITLIQQLFKTTSLVTVERV